MHRSTKAHFIILKCKEEACTASSFYAEIRLIERNPLYLVKLTFSSSALRTDAPVAPSTSVSV